MEPNENPASGVRASEPLKCPDEEAFRQFQRDRITEAQRHDAEQAKPSLACAFKCGWPAKCCVHGTTGVPASAPAEPDAGGMTIAKALRQGLKAEPWLARGTGPEACVGICAIQLQGWWHTAESAKQWAEGYNRAVEHMRAAYGVNPCDAMPADVAEQYAFFRRVATDHAYYADRLDKLAAWLETRLASGVPGPDGSKR